ncbi:magnesium transporter [Candidatus Nomurabacteria bacterium]|nr:magnesium transporter [Candidatus Nomurabacteria bacterium]
MLNEVKVRLTWLVIGLFASLLTAGLINNFDQVLDRNLVLASFIPLIVYMSDAVGTQMEAMIIRELNNKKKFNFRGFFQRQLIVVTIIGMIIASIATGVVGIWKSDFNLAIVVGASLLSGILTSLVTGAVMPYFFWKLHQDPAEASGPIATVIQDFLSVLVFFLVASVLL